MAGEIRRRTGDAYPSRKMTFPIVPQKKPDSRQRPTKAVGKGSKTVSALSEIPRRSNVNLARFVCVFFFLRKSLRAIVQARFSEDAQPLIRPYLDIVRSFNPQGGPLKAYPGSPLIARALLRPEDRLTACEVKSSARRDLIDALRRDTQARVVDLDGWTALPAFVPPKERRGLVLIDPPYEQKDEFERLAAGFAEAFVKWPTGSYLLWYPAKSRRATDELARQVAQTIGDARPPGKCLRVEFSVAPQTASAALTSAGLLVVNPPWTLAAELKTILPEFEKPLGQGGAGRFRLVPSI